MQDKKRFCNICTLKSVLSLLDSPTYLKEKSTAQGIKIIKLIVPSSLTSTCSFMTNPSTDFCCFLTGKAIIEGILQKGAYNCHTVDHTSDKKKLKKSQVLHAWKWKLALAHSPMQVLKCHGRVQIVHFLLHIS